MSEEAKSGTAGVNRTPIAVIGMACWYPGARDIRQFWENILARRREFRRFPDCRLPLSEYRDPSGEDPDKTYADRAAFIDGFQFDWAGHRIPKSSYESADIAHWLALEVALRTIADAGFAKGSIPSERTGVVLGNTLTGEYTRSTFYLRTRWPLVRRSLVASAKARGLSKPLVDDLAATMERYYKSVFNAATEDSLPGNMSNTIAGRICNFLDLHGGGYTVDGACSSSLISIATASRHLVTGELDLALAGGVDISLDTFEMVGFARVGAVTKEEMRVYDRRASGFLPGEGCGMVALKRLEDARRDGNYVYAVLNGWGISSDGKGGLTAPSKVGQSLAIRRAYEHAGYSPKEISFIEGHGTGTAVGDPVELEAIAENLSAGSEAAPKSCGITSVKTIIGHTKAAAGVAGFIKAVAAVNRRVLPPMAGLRDPNPLFETTARALYPILEGEIRDSTERIRAGVQAMGFGGINCHMTIESADPPSDKFNPSIGERALLVSNQLTEVFILSADTIPALLARLDAVRTEAAGISYGELADLAAQLARESNFRAPVRAAVVAGLPSDLVEQLTKLEQVLHDSPPAEGQVYSGVLRDVWASNAVQKLRLGFLFPGQGSQKLNMGRVLCERYPWARDQVRQADEWLESVGAEPVGERMLRSLDRAGKEQVEKWTRGLTKTEVAQPAICLASVVWFRFLTERLGIQPSAVAGHSLGELTAFHAAGAFGDKALMQLAAVRGRAMAAKAGAAGTMASLSCPAEKAEQILKLVSGYAVVANINSPSQTVISGEPSAIAAAIKQAETEGIRCRRLSVSNAFHTKLVEGAADVLRKEAPIPEELVPTGIRIFSGVSGRQVLPGISLREHFADQVLAKVDFLGTVQAMAGECDLFLEVGPGRVLSGLANDILEEGSRNQGIKDSSDRSLESSNPGPLGSSALMCLPVEPEPGRDRDFNYALAALFTHGVPVKWDALYENRLVRPYVPPAKRIFIDNPCERPFRVSEKDAGGPVTGYGGQLESLIAEAAGVAPEKVSQYVAQRGRFLAEVAKADLQATPLPDTAAASSPLPAGGEDKGEGAGGTQSASDILLDLVEKRTGFPRSTLAPEMRMLDDLNLDSIKAAELIAQAAKRMNVAGRIDTLKSANATLAQVAEALEKLKAGGGSPEAAAGPARPTWVRDFGIKYIPEPIPVVVPKDQKLAWVGARFLIMSEQTESAITKHLSERLTEASAQVRVATFAEVREGNLTADPDITHAISILPRVAPTDAYLPSIIGRLQTAVLPSRPSTAVPATVAFVQFGGGRFGAFSTTEAVPKADWLDEIACCCARALAATLYLEHPDAKVHVLDFDRSVDDAALTNRVLAELDTPAGFHAVGYDDRLSRLVPRPRVQEPAGRAPRGITWSQDDVVLFTGGGKGITAECALALARRTGVRVALVGSSPHPAAAESAGVAQTLARFEAEGLSASYYQCDVTDPDAVHALAVRVNQEMGKVTGVVHGAARNEPRSLDRASADEALAEVSPKVVGALNLCHVFEDSPPKLMVGFSSVIGVTGMPRNGWYGFSNEALDLILRSFRRKHPETQVLTIAYSMWSEVGMGVSLGSAKYLAELGVGGVSTSEGVGRFLRLFETDPGEQLVLVTGPLGRYSDLTWRSETGLSKEVNPLLPGYSDLTWQPKGSPAPGAARFLEQVVSAEPEVGATCRARLALDRDLYLKDHNYNGSYLFPTVFGLEAMAQAVAYVTGKWSSGQVAQWSAVEGSRVQGSKGSSEELTPLSLERERAGVRANSQSASAVPDSGDSSSCLGALVVSPPGCLTLRVEDIKLERPIVVDPDKGLNIEIWAEVQERVAPDAPLKVKAAIGTENTGFSTDHFAATFVLGEDSRNQGVEDSSVEQKPLSLERERDRVRVTPDSESEKLPDSSSRLGDLVVKDPIPVPIDPKRDLYGRYLFQGSMFQRIERIESLDSKHMAFWARYDLPSCLGAFVVKDSEPPSGVHQRSSAVSLVLGDPFFLDALLQSPQLLIPQDVALPVHIGSIEYCMPGAAPAGSIRAVATADDRKEQDVTCSVTAFDDRGSVLIRLNGYTVRILEHHPENPTAEELANPVERDERLLREELRKRCEQLGLTPPELVLWHVPGIHDMKKAQRREAELPLFRRALSSSSFIPHPSSLVEWLPSGKPVVSGPNPDNIGVSDSHDGYVYVVIAGKGPVGCDLAAITARSREDWIALLGNEQEQLLEELIESGDPLDVAGTRIWSARETMRKAADSVEFGVAFDRREGPAVLFTGTASKQRLLTLTVPARLTRGPELMFAATAATAL